MEKWIDIKGLEGFYQISNFGNVRSVQRVVNKRKYKSVPITAHITYGGYYSVQLRKCITKTIYYVHRLVALHFVDGYYDGAHVNHIDNNKLNNNAENLEWVSISENKKHTPTQNSSRKYTMEQVKEIRQLYLKGMSIYRISKNYKDNSGTISNIINYKTYKI